MFEEYHFSENAKIITSRIPGSKSEELLRKQEELESNNRSYPRGIPIAFDKAKGASVADVDGNMYLGKGKGVRYLFGSSDCVSSKLKTTKNTLSKCVCHTGTERNLQNAACYSVALAKDGSLGRTAFERLNGSIIWMLRQLKTNKPAFATGLIN